MANMMQGTYIKWQQITMTSLHFNLYVARSRDDFNWKAYLVYNLNIYNTKIKPTHPNGSRSGPVCGMS